MDLKERFLKYVSFDTQSDENSTTFPSTEKQKVLLAALRDEMETLGMTEVTMDQYGYVMGTIPASKGCENAPVIGFIAHVDTSPDMSGKEIKPRVIEEYDGSDIPLNGQLTMKVSDFPELTFFKGHTLIHTDGTTLLGADDKAGIAEILTAVEELLAEGGAHASLRIGFTPDEEIGRGADRFDLAHFGADYAYTVDGGTLGELEYENFNAANAHIHFTGFNIHPGEAKNKMRNAILLAQEFLSLMPPAETPAHTEGREGFFHVNRIEGNESAADLYFLIRDHDRTAFGARKEQLSRMASYLNGKYGSDTRHGWNSLPSARQPADAGRRRYVGLLDREHRHADRPGPGRDGACGQVVGLSGRYQIPRPHVRTAKAERIRVQTVARKCGIKYEA